ncbi:MAG: GntR family transcriptional regulator [Bauldia sp.]|nr:GntR family transcriptional regulator [Bauldia sp.]MCC0044067.1 GntR family transcriptional regulator [Brucellaceae bacterium]
MAQHEESAPSTLSEQTYSTLVSMIMSKELEGGQVLEERPLSKKLSVSRTPLRIAFGRLLGEGLTRRLSNGYYVVNAPTTEDYLHLLQLRRLLEADAASRAAGNLPKAVSQSLRERLTAMQDREFDEDDDATATFELDDDFHEAIADASGNPWLARTIKDVRRRVRMCNVKRYPGRFRQTCQEHLAILDAIDKGDAEGARKALEAHLDEVWTGFMQLLTKR